MQSCLSWIPAQSSVYVVLAVQRYGHPCIISFLWSSVEHITVDVSLTNSDATFFYRDTLHNICRGPSLDFLAVLSHATWLPCWCLSCNLTFRSGLPRQSKFHLRSSSCLCELFDAPPSHIPFSWSVPRIFCFVLPDIVALPNGDAPVKMQYDVFWRDPGSGLA